MNRYILLFTTCTCFAFHSAVAATNLLSIHFVVEEVFPQWEPGRMPKPESLTLISPPVLSDKDFVSFDLSNQTFTVTPEAAKQLSAKIRGNSAPTILNGGVYELIPYPTPFVLKASGEPIYVGAFYTLVSSSSFAGPVILPDPGGIFISTNLTTNVTCHIFLGYPGEFPGMADPRRDSRIISAVNKLFAHEKP